MSSRSTPRRGTAASRPPRGGFTLIELTWRSSAGLIVALGIVGLSREATRTFNEEVRSRRPRRRSARRSTACERTSRAPGT